MISSIGTTSATAAAAYARTQASATLSDTADDTATTASPSEGSFGALLQGALENAIATGKTAEKKAAGGLTGKGNLTDIVTSVSESQMVLQTASAVRDRVIQSYQEIMRMTI